MKIQGVVGCLLVCVGVGFFSIPAALIVAGVLLIVDLLT